LIQAAPPRRRRRRARRHPPATTSRCSKSPTPLASPPAT